MSNITTITLITSVLDEDTVTEIVNNWMEENDYPFLEKVDRFYGGNKKSQPDVYGGAYNYFRDEDFISLFKHTEWVYPEHCIMILINEDNVEIYKADA